MTLRILNYQKLLFSLLISSFLLGGADTTDIDLDALWETTIWEEIDEIIEVEGEVEICRCSCDSGTNVADRFGSASRPIRS